MKWGREVLLNQRDVDGDEWGLLYENTVTLLGGENTLYEVGAGGTAGPESGGCG